MKNPPAFQDAIFIIEKLAAISATPGINNETLEVTNKHIQMLLNSIIKEEITSLSSKLIL